ncbi:MAG TPA: hypothetical protein VK203_11845 [Nostocaceae cyanobacterium]|nr:hypothetical protein [Nostocaceae cyanobacterium]
MTVQVPWKKAPLLAEETQDLGTEATGILAIAKHGALSPNEEIAVSDYWLSVGNKSLSEAKVGLATIILRSRVDKNWTEEDTRKLPQFGLVEEIYDFVISERTRWAGEKYLLLAQGSQGYDAALVVANSQNACVAVSPEIKNTWFVYYYQDVPQGFNILFSPTASDSPIVASLPEPTTKKGNR